MFLTYRKLKIDLIDFKETWGHLHPFMWRPKPVIFDGAVGPSQSVAVGTKTGIMSQIMLS